MSLFDNLTAQLPFLKKADEAEYFFALNIGLSQVWAVVWGVENHHLEILSKANLPYADQEDLFKKANYCLDDALGNMGVDPTKILFGVPTSWGVDDNLKEPYLKLLRKMVKEYELEPMAYVTTTHALAHYLQKKDSNPPTAVLLGIGDFIEASLLKGGKVSENHTIKRTGQMFSDIERALLSFVEAEVLPSKILLYPTKAGEDLEQIKDELISYPWMQKLPFIHFPKIEALDKDVITTAIVLAGAVEIDPQLDFKHHIFDKNPTVKEGGLLNKSVGLKEPEKIGKRSLETHKEEESSDVGFVEGDIKSKLHGAHQTPPFSDEATHDMTQIEEAEDLEHDNLISPELEEEPDSLIGYEGPLFDDSQSKHSRAEREDDRPTRGGKTGILGFLTKISKVNFPKISFGLSGLIKSPLILLPILLIIAALVYVWFATAQVTIYVNPQVLEKDAQITADPAASSVDPDQKIIPGTVIETSVEGSKKGSASGQAQVGDPAKGQIVIYNQTNSPKDFSAGTVLTGPNGLKFTLDSDTTVASESAVEGGISFGKATASVTASAIGPDSNLSAGTALNFSDNSYSAKVDQTFSGGTSQTVTMVTAQDQQNLKNSLISDLKQKAQADLESKVSDGKKVIPDALQVVGETDSFSNRVGDQASSLTLSSTVKFQDVAYSDSDLNAIVAKLVEGQVPDGFNLDPSQIQSNFTLSKVDKDGKLIFLAKFQAKLMPKFDTEGLKNQLKGKTLSQVNQDIEQLPNVVNSQVTLSPKLPSSIARMPFLPSRINIVVQSQ